MLAEPALAPSWVKQPKQDRARRSLERVLAAGAEVLAQKGFEGFSVAEVCRRAAVSLGSLYGRVEGKDELFLAVHERELARMSAIDAALFADGPRWQALPTDVLTLDVVRTLARHFVDEAPLLRVFILRAAVDERVLLQGSRANEGLERAVTALLMTRAADFAHPDAELAVRTAYRLACDTLLWRIAFGAEFGPGGTLAPAPTYGEWVEQLAAACRTYLLTPAG